MKPGHKNQVPVYSIDKFNREPGKIMEYQVEEFNISRNFKVTYPHRHDDFFEILFITHGTGTYTIDFYSFPIQPDTVFFLSPGQIHELELSPDIRGYIFLFTSAFYHFDKINTLRIFELPFFYPLTVNSPPLHLKSVKDRDILRDLFEKARQETGFELVGKDDIIRALLDILLITLKRLYEVDIQHTFSKSLVLVKRFKKLIEENCTMNLSVKEYAEQLKVKPNHLSETVRHLTGRTPTDLINERMLLEIKRLLLQTDLSISEIAYKLHFSDQSYFSKYFRKLTGVSPQQFRTAHLL